MRFNHKAFFVGYKQHFDPTLDQSQVDAIEYLLDRFEESLRWNDVRHIAYALATVYHETAASMRPVEEGYYLGSKARVKAFQKTLRYYPFYGRGYVQLTWNTRRIPNYSKASRALGVDFVANPDLVMEPEYAFEIMTLGMHEGWFTEKKLSDYIRGDQCDYLNARRIINGTDKAALIAGYARKFERILQSALVSAAAAPPSGSDPKSSDTADVTASSSPSPGVQTSPGDADTTQPPPTVEVKKEETSLFVKISAAFTAIAGLGLNAGALIQNKLEQMTPLQVVYLIAALGLVVLAVWWYRKAAKGAQARTMQLVEKAADPSQATVKLVK